MKKRSLTSDGKYVDHAHGLGTVTPEMVLKRAHELAEINRRPGNKPTPGDWEEARRELTTTGGTGSDRMEDIPADRRWDPVPGTRGAKTDNMGAEDEQTLAETLVEEGVEEAEHEQMVEGTRESVKKDRDLGDSATNT